MLIDFATLKRIAKDTPELTIAQFVAVWGHKIDDQKRATERERIADKRSKDANGTATTANNEQQPPTYAQRESGLYRFAEQVCGKRAGSFVKTLLVANRNDIDATRAIFKRAQQTNDPRAFIATAAGKVKQNGTGTSVVATAERLIAEERLRQGGGDGPLLDLTPVRSGTS